MIECVVSKFGGSSVKNAESMLRCCQIVERKNLSQLIVVSATQMTTNHLEMFAECARLNDLDKLAEIYNIIVNKHKDLANDLFSSIDTHLKLEILFTELKEIGHEITLEKKIKDNVMARLYSYGERMSSLIFTDLLKLRMPNRNILFFDVAKVLKTNSNYLKAKPDLQKIDFNVNEFLFPLINEKNSVIVTQGFIAKDDLDQWTILGREGSDYTATLLGAALNAKEVEIWTDVPGVASIDPRLTKKAFFYNNLTYDESTNLAINGAKVLFPDTLMPTKIKNIPVFVGSSIEPEKGGTWISALKNEKILFIGVTSLKVNKKNILTCFYPNTNIDRVNKFRKKIEELGLVYIENSQNCLKFEILNSEKEKEILVFSHDLLLEYFKN